MTGCSPSVIRVPVRPPSVTTSWVAAFPLRFGLGRGAGGRGAAPGTPTRVWLTPNRSVLMTRSVAKMKIHRSARKPNRSSWTTIGAFIRRSHCSSSHISRWILPIDQHGMAQADHVAVLQLPALGPVPVDRAAVRRAQVVQDRVRAVELDVDVPA